MRNLLEKKENKGARNENKCSVSEAPSSRYPGSSNHSTEQSRLFYLNATFSFFCFCDYMILLLSSLIWRTAAESQCRVSRSSHGLWIFFYVCQHENDELHEECSAANASNSP
ncbi:hypothetical protein BHM03_00046397 [Ensete ventricosum]|nr:hypothetical protein BHM03_00046397 [Ensete ventricosum]